MKKITALLLVLILVFGFAACNRKEAESTETMETETVEAATPEPTEVPTAEEPAEEVEESHYPVTITTYNRAKEEIEATFEKRPEKVVAVYQNSIETLLALGVEDTIIAATGLDHEVKPEFKEAFEHS